MCDASKQQKDAARAVKDLSAQLTSQATQVFGDASTVFNTIKNAYTGIVNAGPSQQGFSQAELNDMNAKAINQTAAQYRNVAGAAKAGQAGFGGGNAVSAAGATTAANLGIAEAAAQQTSSELGDITQKNYDTGRQNFFAAGQALESAPGVFSTSNQAGEVAGTEANQNYQDQTQIGNAAGWWQKPVMGLINAGLSVASGGLSGLATGDSFSEGASGGLSNVSKGFAGVGSGPQPSNGLQV